MARPEYRESFAPPQVPDNHYRTFSVPHGYHVETPTWQRDPYRTEFPRDHRDSWQAPPMNRSFPPRSHTAPENRAPSPLAAFEVLRKWNLRFSGDHKEDAEAFITRIKEGRLLVHIRDEDILNSIPFFLSGVALYWYRNRRPSWITFDDFERSWRQRFANSDLRLMLREEIRMRTQGEHEHASDYLTCMRTLFDRLRPAWPEEEQLDYAYHNLLPRYQIQIRREELMDLAHLEDLTRQLEVSFRCASHYKPPPPPERSMIPELAYHAPKHAPPRSRQTIAALDFVNESTDFVNAAYVSSSKPAKKLNARPANPPPTAATISSHHGNTARETTTAPANATTRPRDANSTPRPSLCYNCHQPGHQFPECTQPRGMFCYRCGYPNVTKATCPRKCAENLEGSR